MASIDHRPPIRRVARFSQTNHGAMLARSVFLETLDGMLAVGAAPDDAATSKHFRIGTAHHTRASLLARSATTRSPRAYTSALRSIFLLRWRLVRRGMRHGRVRLGWISSLGRRRRNVVGHRVRINVPFVVRHPARVDVLLVLIRSIERLHPAARGRSSIGIANVRPACDRCIAAAMEIARAGPDHALAGELAGPTGCCDSRFALID